MSDTNGPANAFSGLPPIKRDLYYGGAWHKPSGGYDDLINPGTGENLGHAAIANSDDVDAAVMSARTAFRSWRNTKPLERSEMLRAMAQRLRDNAEELALLDAINCGNPVKDMIGDIHAAARRIDLFAGYATEIKGDTMPAGGDTLSMTVREPYGVCARIVAYNHPLLFVAGKMAAPLATGNTLILKPAQQAPLSAYRMMELIGDLAPPGVLNMLSGGAECGAALTAHPLVEAITLVGSPAVGRAIARSAADRLKHVGLELGGKNAMVVYPDADISKAIEGAIKGMNFAWCGQSCASTSRLFLHADIHDEVVSGVVEAAKQYRPGIPTDPATNMGAVISQAHLDRILGYIETGKREGATLLLGGKQVTEGGLDKGFFVEPTIFSDVTPEMTIAQEEIFGPVLSILKWEDEETMLEAVNGVDFGLTAAVYTKSLGSAHRAAAAIEAGLVTVNSPCTFPLGSPFGGYKQSGIGRESSIEELFSFTQIKNITLTF